MSRIKFLLESMAPCYLAGAMKTASNIRATLAFRTASDAPANVTQAANIARLLSSNVIRCAYGSVSL